MNKKYIKRQITLHKLGLPMDSKVKEYYDYFHNLIGDASNFEESDSIFWVKDGEVILEYDTKNEHFYVRYDTIWENFEEKYELNYDIISELLSGLLEEAFKLRVTTATKRCKMSWLTLEEAFKLRVTTAKRENPTAPDMLEEAFKLRVTTAWIHSFNF